MWKFTPMCNEELCLYSKVPDSSRLVVFLLIAVCGGGSFHCTALLYYVLMRGFPSLELLSKESLKSLESSHTAEAALSHQKVLSTRC